MPPVPVTEGPYTGWHRWRARDEGRFVDTIGTLYFRVEADGSVVTRMETERRHSNTLDFLHGGLLMSFIDMTLFSIIHPYLGNEAAVTLSCATDFLSAGIVGKPIEGRGEVLKETGKMFFVRGLITQDDGAYRVCSFTGSMRKITRRR